MRHAKKLVLGALLVATPLLSYVTFAGTPKWPLAGGYHYVADLLPASFPPASVWDNNAQFSMSDWRDMGATSFQSGFTRNASDPTNHTDGRNTWAWMNRPADTYLGVTFVRYTGATMTDCDIWFNSRTDYSWTTGLLDPTIQRPYWPQDFRNVARHECGHAIGFDHEDAVLDNMNSIVQHGAGVQHGGGSGQLPHADDKLGCRTLYPAAGSVVNLMATRWREPLAGVNNNGPRWLDSSGNWNAGGTYPVQVWLENQSNVAVAAGVRIGIYLSNDAVISTADLKIGDYTFGAWPANGEFLYTFNGTVPQNQPAGNYWVGAVLDNVNAIVEQFEADNYALLGQVAVANTLRGLGVQSSNPAAGVAITVTPLDANGLGSGMTPLLRNFWDSEAVTLTAPSQMSGQPFRRWVLDGTPQPGGNLVLQVTMSANRNAVAEYTALVPGAFYKYGPGCVGTPSFPPIHEGNAARGYPFLNELMSFDMRGARLNTAAALFVGMSNTQWGSFALPLGLTPYGVTGCWIECSLDAIVGSSTNGAGIASVPLLVPNVPFLLGKSVYSQFVYLDPGAPRPVGATLSNGLHSVIGGNQ